MLTSMKSEKTVQAELEQCLLREPGQSNARSPHLSCINILAQTKAPHESRWVYSHYIPTVFLGLPTLV